MMTTTNANCILCGIPSNHCCEKKTKTTSIIVDSTLMASISSSTVMASLSDNPFSYDVFLSFSGEDTRNSFTDHLYHGLIQAGVRTYRDNEGIDKGGELKSELKRAIQRSRASIVVLSKNYATSTWCLDELVLILEQKKKSNQFVLPVFYGVEPTDVRNHRGSFAMESKHSSKWTDDNVSQWKAALTDVANMAGHVLSGPETSFLKEIVDTVYNKLDLKKVGLPLNLIGMNTRCDEINSWLYRPNAPVLAIYGMGGSGKTTLARHVYNSHWTSFESVSFVGDIGSRCERRNDLVEVQEQLLNDLVRGKERKIPCVYRGTPMIEDALKTKRCLIVLDDIVGHSQLVDLLGTEEMNAKSKIIITTREDTRCWPNFRGRICQTYQMGLLDDNESSQLLCHHAFESKVPKAGFEELVLRATQYCGGNPLALEVLGSSLYNNGVEFWASELRSLEGNIDAQVESVLIRSYESLPSDTVKELFLHIACFFNGMDMDYVVKILEPDYSAISGINKLVNKCLLSVSPNKTLMMHKLIQEMGRHKVRQESTLPAKRSRVWLSSDSYKILRKGTGSKKVKGLALDMKLLSKENISVKSPTLKTDALKKMDNLKLLQLNFVELNGSYENFSEDLRWLCWLGFSLRAIPSDLCMGKLVSIDMSYSKLEVFEPPEVLQCLQTLNLKDSHKLSEIRNISNIPRLETLILWNCYSLVHVCKTIEGLGSLALLNMTGCKNLFNTEQSTFSFPSSLHRLFIKDCNLDCIDSLPLSFIDHQNLQYLNLGNNLFESLPCYGHLKNLRVLDLSFCSRLQCLLRLPSTLAELYVYNCELLERITFQSPRFPLQEFGYLGCINLYEVEGFIKLLPIANLNESDLGHMKWLQEYQNHQVRLVGDDELTVGRSWRIQMLYEFNIMSTSLPDIEDLRMTTEYTSKSSFLSFDVPLCPKNKRLKGVNANFKYALSGDDWVWFCKISTANGVVDLIYNPKVFGKPEVGDACTWLSYWPIGDKLKPGDTVHVSIVETKGMKVHECGVSLVYSDQETLDMEMGWEEILGGDLSRFQLSTGGHYLCRRDFSELMEVDRLSPDWFTVLVGNTIDYTDVRGWRKTGRPKHMNQSFTEVKFMRCIIHGPQFEDIYKIAEMSKLSIGDKTLASTSNLIERGMKSVTLSDTIDKAMEEHASGEEAVGDVISFKPSSEIVAEHERITNPATGESEHSSSLPSTYPWICRRFSFTEIQSATRNFNDGLILGRGRFGTVYRGQMYKEDGEHVVAIKRWNPMSSLGEVEFRTEIDTLCKFHHRHLVSLIGYCDHTNEKILIYEYMPNGSLRSHLQNGGTSLNLVTRLKIALGVARGLEYLDCHGVVHRNVNSLNILLDKNYEAVISGFGSSIINPPIEDVVDSVKGTPGYVDPEYLANGKLTWKIDVYSFGVVLFELLSGMPVLDYNRREEQRNLVEWARKCVEKRNLNQLVDSNITETISTESLNSFAKLAYHCVHNSSEDRPTMTEVATSLETLLKLYQKQEKPNRPAESSGHTGFARKVYNYFVRRSCTMTSICCKGEDFSRSCCWRCCFLTKTKRKQD